MTTTISSEITNINYQRVAEAIEYLTENFKSQPSLDEVAKQVHLSPTHFQKIFTEWAGVSPKKFIQYLTVDYLRNKIYDADNLHHAADIAGLSTSSRVHDLFVTIEAVTPNEYKTGGEGLEIFFGFHHTAFGECFIAVTERGICALSFIHDDSKENEVKQLKKNWSSARITENQTRTEPYVHKIFEEKAPEKMNLLVHGTNFQLKVWEALLKIPQGAVSTYAQIAKAINNPKAVRAVGTAIGNNPIAYLIPCHRVIRNEGKTGDYHWGATRKKTIIGWEMALRDKG